MYAVVKHRSDGSDWIVEVLPNAEEAAEWAQVFRDQETSPGVTYTAEPADPA